MKSEKGHKAVGRCDMKDNVVENRNEISVRKRKLSVVESKVGY